MYFKKNKLRKILCLGMAFTMIATSAPLWQMPIEVKAAEETVSSEEEGVTLQSVRAEAAESYESDRLGFDIEFEPKTVTSGISYSDTNGSHYLETLNNLRMGEDDQTIIIRFKTTQANGLLFGAGTDTTENGKNMIFALKSGQIRMILRNTNASGGVTTGCKGNVGSGYNDGNYHTLAVSFLPSMGRTSGNVRLVVDGGENLYPANWGENHVVGLNQQPSDAYTKFEIAGGTYAYADPCNSTAFNGEIDFFTVINKAYSVEELQDITIGDLSVESIFAGMFTSSTNHTWLFTGGTEGVADFASNKTVRNWVGLFETDFREAGTFAERGRFVFNTSKRGADVAQILEEYDTRVKAYGTKVVGIMVGAADYRKGQEGVEAFKDTLQQFMEKVRSDKKAPLILTPYPSKKQGDAENITLYTQAINQVAEGKAKIVDLSSISLDYINEDGTLTPLGHQAVANAARTAVGKGTLSYSLDRLSDGSYTVAKQTESKELAQIKEAVVEEGQLKVSVDSDSISGNSAQLEYTLTNTKGEVISSTVPSGETEFTVDGLQEGEIYTLNVYDVSRGNVKESYQPVRIAFMEDAKGADIEYEDGNVLAEGAYEPANEAIQELFTSDRPVTYLFMGDSITHGVVTGGYDNVPQMFAKYLDELGRTEDIVLNTGVTNATIATTLDQIEPRLKRYHPDVVMIMLGTNDSSTNGENEVTVSGMTASRYGISVEDYVTRYKELVREIHRTNPDACIVLRVPCSMISQLVAHAGFEDKFAAIYTVASEMRQEIEGLNITVVNHIREWENYRDTVRNDNLAWNDYGWFQLWAPKSSDGIHPNARGNLSMFQQIIKELGIYVNTSELANYQHGLNEWTATSNITAPVTQRASRASFAMSSLSGYTNGLQDVTLTLTENGKAISKKAAYSADGTITISGLDPSKTYTATVTGKDGQNSKEVTFDAALTKTADDAATATVTEAEGKELTDSIAAEKEFLETSSYPKEIQTAYANVIAAYEDIDTNGMTIEELDEILADIRIAKANAVIALQEYNAAKKELEEAVIVSKRDYMDKEADYKNLPSWQDYTWAYADASEGVDENTTLQDLKEYLSYLKETESKLESEKAEADKNPPKEPTKGDPDIITQKTLELGKVYYVNDYGYKVTDLSAKTVEFAGIKTENLTKLVVGSEVKLEDDKIYTVTSISAGIFKNYKNKGNVTDVIIHANIETIEKQAFAGYKKLKAVELNSTQLKSIGVKAFSGCKKLKKIVIKSMVLKTVGKQAFKGTASKLTITVPKKSYKNYSKKVLKNKGQSKTAKIKKGK